MRQVAVALTVALAATTAVAQTYTIDGNCRDGQPHGAYELRGAGGQMRAVGAFNRGKRTGSFLFWSSTGARIAQLPYDEDVLSGTLAAWYAGANRSAEPKAKLEAVYVAGRPSGVQRSWYPNGNVRAEFRYDHGVLVEARAFGESGKPLPDAQARALAAKDHDNDAQLIASLESIVRSHLPRCEPASDRLEKG